MEIIRMANAMRPLIILQADPVDIKMTMIFFPIVPLRAVNITISRNERVGAADSYPSIWKWMKGRARIAYSLLLARLLPLP